MDGHGGAVRARPRARDEAIDRADLILAVGHDTVEKPPFIMRPGGPQVVHVGYTPAHVEEVYFPQAAYVFADLADVVTNAPLAADAADATRMDLSGPR